MLFENMELRTPQFSTHHLAHLSILGGKEACLDSGLVDICHRKDRLYAKPAVSCTKVNKFLQRLPGMCRICLTAQLTLWSSQCNQVIATLSMASQYCHCGNTNVRKHLFFCCSFKADLTKQTTISWNPALMTFSNLPGPNSKPRYRSGQHLS